MSTEDDLELRDLLVQTLEKNGTLAKLRAQLRANIFLALDEQEKVKNKSPLLNEAAQKFASNDEGRLCLELVVDLLKCLKMDCSETVFVPESGLTYQKSRDDLASGLGISVNDSERSQPLLYMLLDRFKNSPFDNNNAAKGDFVYKEKVNGPTNVDLNEEFKPATEVDDDFFNEAPPPLSYSVTSSVTQRQKISSKQGPLEAEISGRKNLTNISPSDAAVNVSTASSFLGDLPELPRKTPLQSSSLPHVGSTAEDKKPTNNQRDLNLKKLIGESFDDMSGESDSSLKSSKSSSERRKLKNDAPPKAAIAKKDPVHEQGDEKSSKNSYLFNPRGDSKNGGHSVDDDVSEEIVEDLEIDDLLNSARSPHQISF